MGGCFCPFWCILAKAKRRFWPEKRVNIGKMGDLRGLAGPNFVKNFIFGRKKVTLFGKYLGDYGIEKKGF